MPKNLSDYRNHGDLIKRRKAYKEAAHRVSQNLGKRETHQHLGKTIRVLYL